MKKLFSIFLIMKTINIHLNKMKFYNKILDEALPSFEILSKDWNICGANESLEALPVINTYKLAS